MLRYLSHLFANERVFKLLSAGSLKNLKMYFVHIVAGIDHFKDTLK